MTDGCCRSAAPLSKRERRCGGQLRPPQIVSGGKADEGFFWFRSEACGRNRNAARVPVSRFVLGSGFGAGAAVTAIAAPAFSDSYADAKADAYRHTISLPHSNANADPDTDHHLYAWPNADSSCQRADEG